MICKSCNSNLDDSDFYAGVKSRCKTCHKSAMKVLRLLDPKVQERDRNRAKTSERKKRARAVTIKWRQDHPEAYRAHNAVNNAIRDGKLQKQPCWICSTDKNVHAHHSDYSRPLDVKWLCAKCHHRIHAVFPQLHGHGIST